MASEMVASEKRVESVESYNRLLLQTNKEICQRLWLLQQTVNVAMKSLVDTVASKPI